MKARLFFMFIMLICLFLAGCAVAPAPQAPDDASSVSPPQTSATENTPEQEADNTPEQEAGNIPEQEAGNTPEQEAGNTPEQEADNTPEQEADNTPEQETGNTPEQETDNTPEEPEEKPEPKPVPVLEPITDNQSPMLRSLSVDGGYSLEFQPELRTYELYIPAGRPRVPKLTAEPAPDTTVNIVQAAIPDSQSWGMASVTVEDMQGQTGTYEVLIIKDPAMGFHLQYQDRWQFSPDAAQVDGGDVTYTSSDPEILQVDSNGMLTVKRLTAQPVTIEAAVDGAVVDSLTVDQIVPAVVNIFLITGQSNASGTLDIPPGMRELDYKLQELKEVLRPDPGTAYCTDINIVGQTERSMYDLAEGRIGFSPALAKTWYDLTGEKVMVLQTAVGGSPIEAWMKPEGDVRYTYLFPEANLYETTTKSYQNLIRVLTMPGSGYEINNTFAYWLQGETGICHTFNPDKVAPGVGDFDWFSRENLLSAQDYYDAFSKNMEYFREELNVDFMGILLVRCLQEASSMESLGLQLLTDMVPVRAAQYALNNDGIADVGLVSRVCDIARKESYRDTSVEGWGYMGCNNLHYDQKGYNAQGIAAAENTFGYIYGGVERTATEIEWIQKNGRDRFADGDILTLKEGETYQTAAIVLPLYTDSEIVTYTSDRPEVCTVDRFGLLTAVGAAGSSATVTITCPGTDLSKTITVSITE